MTSKNFPLETLAHVQTHVYREAAVRRLLRKAGDRAAGPGGLTPNREEFRDSGGDQIRDLGTKGSGQLRVCNRRGRKHVVAWI